MQAIRQLIKPINGKITIILPEQHANQELEVIIRPLQQSQALTKENKKNYDFSDLLGKLQWKGDALEEQKKLRDELS